MYYEEKLIDGVLMCRSTPNGVWRQVCIHSMSKRLYEADRELHKNRALVNDINEACLNASANSKVIPISKIRKLLRMWNAY